MGLTTAWHLERKLHAGTADVTLINPQNYTVYPSLLPEVASGMLEPADVVVSLRRVLGRTRLVVGELTDLDDRAGTCTVAPTEAEPYDMAFDFVVLAVGSATKVLPVPGLEEQAVGFTTVPEAMFLRDHVLARLEAAAQAEDDTARARALTFVVVGGGYSGVEAIGELEAMAAGAIDLYPELRDIPQRWILIEATDRILPMVDVELAARAARALRHRGIDVRLETVLESAEDDRLRLSDGETLEADTLVWAAGIVPNPLLADLGLPCNEAGAVEVDATLRVRGRPRLWAAGDCADVPDLVGGGSCPPSAQYALREARQVADNLAAAVTGGRLRPFRYRMLGEMLTLGRHEGVAQIGGRHLHGFAPWYLRRLYHVARVPTLRRKVQVWSDWTLRLLTGRDVVSLGELRRPDLPLTRATEAQQD